MQGKVVLLTGGAGPNMGGAIAKAFARAGATLIVADVEGARAQSAAADLRDAGGAVFGVQLDVGDRNACAEAVEQTVRQHGRIDVLFNHAGFVGPFSAAGTTSDEVWDAAMSINLSAPFFLARAALRHMLEQHGGVITNTISEAGLRGGAAGAAYTATKHGLVGLTKAIAWAYGKDGIRCNGICPGGVMDMDLGDPATIELPFPADGPRQDLPRVEPVMRLGPRFLKPAEIANLAVFLSSDAASGINGQMIAADAGWSAG